MTPTELLAQANSLNHHALLLSSSRLPEAGLEPALFVQMARALCQVELSAPTTEDFWAACARHPDVFVAPPERNILRLEDLAPIRARAFYPPTMASRRLFFIDRCERMNTNTANALLKVLEEPPAAALFLLTCRKLADVLPTITSRCRKINLALPALDATDALASLEPEERDKIAQTFARLAQAPAHALTTESAWEKLPVRWEATDVRAALELAEGLAKRHEAAQLIDAITAQLARSLSARSEALPLTRFIQQDLRAWRDALPFNPSAQLWLARIFLRLSALPKTS